MGSRKTARSASPRRSPKPRASPKETAPAEATKKKYASGTNFVEGGVDENPLFLALVFAGPILCQVLAFVTSAEMKAALVSQNSAGELLQGEPYLSELLPQCFSDLPQCASSVLSAALSVQPSIPAVQFLLGFMALALLLEFLPGKLVRHRACTSRARVRPRAHNLPVCVCMRCLCVVARTDRAHF